MIKNTSDSINAICGLCGFDDHSYFQKFQEGLMRVPELYAVEYADNISQIYPSAV